MLKKEKKLESLKNCFQLFGSLPFLKNVTGRGFEVVMCNTTSEVNGVIVIHKTLIKDSVKFYPAPENSLKG